MIETRKRKDRVVWGSVRVDLMRFLLLSGAMDALR